MSNDKNSAIEPWLQNLWDKGGSDLLLSGGSAPRIRVDGKLIPVEREFGSCGNCGPIDSRSPAFRILKEAQAAQER